MKDAPATKYTKVRQQDDIVILQPRGDFTGDDETDELEALIDFYDGRGTRSLIVNFSDTRLVNSTALGVLVGAHKKFTKRGARAVICNVDKRLTNALVIARLSTVFDVRSDEAAAIAACQASPQQG